MENTWSADPLSGKQLLLLLVHGLEQVALPLDTSQVSQIPTHLLLLLDIQIHVSWGTRLLDTDAISHTNANKRTNANKHKHTITHRRKHTETHASYLVTVKSRLIPVAIAAFRYIMVCHAVFVQNHGGEKRVLNLKLFPTHALQQLQGHSKGSIS